LLEVLFSFAPLTFQEDKRVDISMVRTLLFNMGYAKLAAFHSMLCIAANDIAVRDGTLDSQDAIKHRTAASSLVKKEVSGWKPNSSDGFLAAVTLLANNEV
jgi:hypothetical protein